MVMIRISLGDTSLAMRWPDEREYFDELQSNGSNPDIEKITFGHWTRPLDERLINSVPNDIDHFIFGWLETYFQSSQPAGWMWDDQSKLTVEVW